MQRRASLTGFGYLDIDRLAERAEEFRVSEALRRYQVTSERVRNVSGETKRQVEARVLQDNVDEWAGL